MENLAAKGELDKHSLKKIKIRAKRGTQLSSWILEGHENKGPQTD